MIDYTARLASLMQDIVKRVPTLSFIDMRDVLVFARFGRSGQAGPVATCHSLSLPPSEPGYYFWRDRQTGAVTRRSEWFVAKSPTVTVDDRQIRYLISFALPRFCDQALRRSRKERFYRRSTDCWIAKLDTVIHELYHIDPEHNGIRRLERGDGTCLSNAHPPQFFAKVAEMVSQYLDSRPDPEAFEFLKHDLATLTARHGGVSGCSFRPFPSYPQRFLERLDPQPPMTDPAMLSVDVEPWKHSSRRTVFTEQHLNAREFLQESSRRKGDGRRGDPARAA